MHVLLLLENQKGRQRTRSQRPLPPYYTNFRSVTGMGNSEDVEFLLRADDGPGAGVDLVLVLMEAEADRPAPVPFARKPKRQMRRLAAPPAGIQRFRGK